MNYREDPSLIFVTLPLSCGWLHHGAYMEQLSDLMWGNLIVKKAKIIIHIRNAAVSILTRKGEGGKDIKH